MQTWETRTGQRIYRILGGRCNCYLVSNRGKFLLVDAGRKTAWKRLKARLAALGVTSGSLAALVLTHTHFDHAENAAQVKKTYGTDIILHRSEADCLTRGKNPVIRGSFLIPRLLTDIVNHRALSGLLDYPPCAPDIFMGDRFDLEPLGFHGRLIHTPGHTEGSICALFDDEIALAGDTVFGIFKGSAFPPFAGDSRILVQSWKTLLASGCRLFLPAHGRERDQKALGRQYEQYQKRVAP